jgi:hypothetical protein
MNKLLLITLLVGVLGSVNCEINQDNARFIGSIGNLINNNIIKPIKDVGEQIGGGIIDAVNLIGNGANQVIGGISGVGISVSDFFTGTLPSSVQAAIGAVKNQLEDVPNMALIVLGTVLNGGKLPTGEAPPDPCKSTCLQQFKERETGNLLTYYFDKPYGCISKGTTSPETQIFDDCCNKHNECLNSRCCTTDCQELKNDCDRKYSRCMNTLCFPLNELSNDDFTACLAVANIMLEQSVKRTCNIGTNIERKICYC